MTSTQWYEVAVTDGGPQGYCYQVTEYVEGRTPYGMIQVPFGDGGFFNSPEEAFLHAGMFIGKHFS